MDRMGQTVGISAKAKKLDLFFIALLTVIFLLVFDFVQNNAAKSEPRECPFPTEETDLSYCDFSGVDFGDENLAFRDLSGANLNGAKLADTNLTMVRSGSIIGTPDNLPIGWVIRNGYLVGAGADLSNAYLQGEDLSNLNLEGSILQNSNLSNTNLTLTSLAGASVEGANLNGARLDSTNVEATNFSGSTVENARLYRLTGTPSELPTGYRFFQRPPGSFYASTFLGPRVDFYATDFRAITLQNENLAGANFTKAQVYDRICKTYSKGQCSVWQARYPLRILQSDLRESNFSGLILDSNEIANSNLSSANLQNMQAKNLTFSGINDLSYSNLSESVFQNSSFFGIDFRTVNLNQTQFLSSNLIGTNFSGKDLRTLNFYDSDLSGSDLSGADLSGLNLTSTRLKGAILTGAKLDGALFPASVLLERVKSGDVLGTPVLPGGWYVKRGYLLGQAANLQGANLSGLNLNSINLSFANLEDTNLSNTSLVGTNLNGASLRGSNLANAFFSNTSSISGLQSGGLVGIPRALPTGWTYAGGFLVEKSVGFRDMDLSGLDLSNLDLKNLDFTLSNLSHVNFNGSDLSGSKFASATMIGTRIQSTNFSSASLSEVVTGNLVGVPSSLPNSWMLARGYLVGPGSKLDGADFSNLDLSSVSLSYASLVNANLESATLIGVNVDGSDFAGAKMGGITSSGLTGRPSRLPESWSLVNQYLVGPGANLDSAVFAGQVSGNFSNANLSEATFRDALLEGATFDNANLDGATFSNIQVTNRISARSIVGMPKILPDTWRIVRGNLVAPMSDLSNLDLSGENLSGLDLDGANFSASNLSNADLSYASAIESDFGQANLLNTKFNNSNAAQANFQGAFGVGADFTGVYLYNSSFANFIFGKDRPFVDADITFSGHPKVGAPIVVSCDQLNPGMSLNAFWTVNGKSRQEGEKLDFTPIASDLEKILAANIVVLLPHKYTFEDENGGFQEGSAAYQMHWKSLTSKVSLGNLAIATEVTMSNPPKVGEDVQAILGSSPEGVTTTFQWLEGARIVSQGPNLVVTPSLSGKSLKIVAVFTKPGFATEQIESDSFIVAKGLMEKPQFQIDGFQEVGEELDAWITNEDGEAEYSYQWFRDGVEIPFEVSKFYQVKAQDVGRLLGVRVRVASQGYDDADAVVTLKKVIPGPKITKFSIPKVEGKPNVAQVISVNVGTWVSNTKFQIQWFKNMQPIANANFKTLRLGVEDFGSDISVRVTGTKTGFLPKVVTSLKVKILPGVLQTMTPNVLGQVKTGSTLTAQSIPSTTGAVISYQWLLDGKPIKMATQQNYTLLKSQKGKSISVVVTQVALGFAKASKTSPSLKIK